MDPVAIESEVEHLQSLDLSSNYSELSHFRDKIVMHLVSGTAIQLMQNQKEPGLLFKSCILLHLAERTWRVDIFYIACKRRQMDTLYRIQTCRLAASR